MNKKLYLLIGPAGAGKTTWVRNNAKAGTSAHISRDRIRFSMVDKDEYYFSREDEVYTKFVDTICEALSSSWVDEVYADATHLSKKSRERLIRKIDRNSCIDFDLIAVVVKPSISQCLEQNAQRTGREYVPESVITKMYTTFQHPYDDDLYYEMIIENDEIIFGKEGQ